MLNLHSATRPHLCQMHCGDGRVGEETSQLSEKTQRAATGRARRLPPPAVAAGPNAADWQDGATLFARPSVRRDRQVVDWRLSAGAQTISCDTRGPRASARVYKDTLPLI